MRPVRDDEPAWHDGPQVVVGGGVAAALLLALLIFAVMRVSEHSSDPSTVTFPAESSVTTSARLVTPSSTSYATPSIRTSEVTPPSPPPPGDEPPVAYPTDGTTTAPSPTNPYATSTTSNAGAI